jgi:hypothetical protein
MSKYRVETNTPEAKPEFDVTKENIFLINKKILPYF